MQVGVRMSTLENLRKPVGNRGATPPLPLLFLGLLRFSVVILRSSWDFNVVPVLI